MKWSVWFPQAFLRNRSDDGKRDVFKTTRTSIRFSVACSKNPGTQNHFDSPALK